MKTVDTGDELREELLKVSDILEDDFAAILQKLAFDGFREVMTRTAIDTGFARSNWMVVVDTPPGDVALSNPSPSGKRIYPDATLSSFRVDGNSIVTIYNNTEYIIHLEHGTPNMRAQPMVEPTYQMLLSVAKQLSDKLSRKKYDV